MMKRAAERKKNIPKGRRNSGEPLNSSVNGGTVITTTDAAKPIRVRIKMADAPLFTPKTSPAVISLSRARTAYNIHGLGRDGLSIFLEGVP